MNNQKTNPLPEHESAKIADEFGRVLEGVLERVGSIQNDIIIDPENSFDVGECLMCGAIVLHPDINALFHFEDKLIVCIECFGKQTKQFDAEDLVEMIVEELQIEWL